MCGCLGSSCIGEMNHLWKVRAQIKVKAQSVSSSKNSSFEKGQNELTMGRERPKKLHLGAHGSRRMTIERSLWMVADVGDRSMRNVNGDEKENLQERFKKQKLVEAEVKRRKKALN